MSSEHSLPLEQGVPTYLLSHAYATQFRREARRRDAIAPPASLAIAISREAGIDAGSYAQTIARQLHWPIWDHELLELIARRLGAPVGALESIDERHVSWIQESLEAFLDAHTITQTNYVHRLVETVQEIASQGDCLLIGRGIAHVLPAETTLKVRLVAPRAQRVDALARQLDIADLDRAGRELDKLDRERTRFVQDHFRRDPTDASHYDLALNLSHLSHDDVARLVLDALAPLEERLGRSPARQRTFASRTGTATSRDGDDDSLRRA